MAILDNEQLNNSLTPSHFSIFYIFWGKNKNLTLPRNFFYFHPGEMSKQWVTTVKNCEVNYRIGKSADHRDVGRGAVGATTSPFENFINCISAQMFKCLNLCPYCPVYTQRLPLWNSCLRPWLTMPPDIDGSIHPPSLTSMSTDPYSLNSSWLDGIYSFHLNT